MRTGKPCACAFLGPCPSRGLWASPKSRESGVSVFGSAVVLTFRHGAEGGDGRWRHCEVSAQASPPLPSLGGESGERDAGTAATLVGGPWPSVWSEVGPSPPQCPGIRLVAGLGRGLCFGVDWPPPLSVRGLAKVGTDLAFSWRLHVVVGELGKVGRRVFGGPRVIFLVSLWDPFQGGHVSWSALFLSLWKPGSLPTFLGFLLLWTALPHVPVEIENWSLPVPPTLPPTFL